LLLADVYLAWAKIYLAFFYYELKGPEFVKFPLFEGACPAV